MPQDINVLFDVTLDSLKIDDVLAKLITAMTREGKFKDAIQDRIRQQLILLIWKSVICIKRKSPSGRTIKTRLEQQMDNLDVTDIHYDKNFRFTETIRYPI